MINRDRNQQTDQIKNLTLKSMLHHPSLMILVKQQKLLNQLYVNECHLKVTWAHVSTDIIIILIIHMYIIKSFMCFEISNNFSTICLLSIFIHKIILVNKIGLIKEINR